MGRIGIFVWYYLQIQGKVNCLGFFLTIMYCIGTPVAGSSQSFIRVNSGTKSNIREVSMTRDGTGYFLTNKIYTLVEDTWKKVDFPVAGAINTFEAISPDDIWFCNTLETSTSLLYHYHNGILENIRTPLGNDISSITFPTQELGFFGSFSDVVIYNQGKFVKVNPVGTRGYIIRIDGSAIDNFWVLSQVNELFVSEMGKFSRLFPDKAVKDFQFITPEHGFILCEDAVIETLRGKIIGQLRHPLLKNARKIYLRKENELWVIGDGGLILVQQNGILQKIRYDGKENLNSVAFNGKNEIWIAGDNGLLLYSGSRKFPVYNESYPGFSSQKLIAYGIDVDNEYGVAIADFNGDGRLDIYAVCISDPDKLFINNIESKQNIPVFHSFLEEAAKRGVIGLNTDKNAAAPSDLKLGVAVADVDNDGDEDIYICSLNGRNKLLLNNGKGFFRNVMDQPNRACDDVNRSNSAVFADVDLDGDLDLFVTSENGSNRLYLNDGNGYFTDITVVSGLASARGGMCSSFSDVNGDGYPDLCVTFWYPSNKIYLNETRNGKVRFRDYTAQTDLAKSEPAKSNAIVIADVNNDGYPDLFIANRHAANKLYLNDGKGIFRDATSMYFDKKEYLTNGAVFADFDLDGFQDLYITNVGDNVMYRNIRGTHFEEVTGTFGTELSGYSTGCAVGDIDNDGDEDFYAANYINGSSLLFVNKMEKKNSVTFKIQGTRSNRNAIGTKIFLYMVRSGGEKDSIAGFREISGGGGYGSISAKEAIFALKPGLKYSACIKFPASGITVIVRNIITGSVILVNEETGFPAFKTLSQKAIIRFFSDPETRLEIVKYLAVLMILLIYLRFQQRGSAYIKAVRWMTCFAIFILFALINRIFLFSTSLIFFVISPALAVIGLVILHLITEKIILKRQSEREKRELREKISRDLHDDLASTLGSISIYSSTLKGMTNISPLKFQHLSAKIAGLTQSALQSITDIIWMTAPRNDSLRSLLSKVSAMMFDVLTDNMIRYDEKVELPAHEIILHDKLRHDTFLILKEALNNAIRHSSAKNVTMRAWYVGSRCFIRLNDDGVGFYVNESPPAGSHGNGLINMHRRASESGIELSVQSNIGSGSCIEISFKI